MTDQYCKPCKFMAVVDGVSKFYNSFAIDVSDAMSQMKEIYGQDTDIEILLFQIKD